MAHLKRIRTPLSTRLADFGRGPLVLLVWVGLVVLSAHLLSRRGQPLPLRAQASTLNRTLTAPVAGRLRGFDVAEFETLRAGQIIGILDDAVLDARLARAEAEIETARAALVAARDALNREIGLDALEASDRDRRYRLDEEQIRLDLTEVEVALATDRIQADRLRLERDRERRLATAGIAADEALAIAELRLRETEEGILRNEQRRSRLEEHLQLARNRREAFMTSMAEVPPRLVDEVLEPLIRSVGVAEKSSLEVRAEYSSRQLRCPIDGMARRVTASDGQHVLEGEPLLEVQSRSCRDVVVWMADGSGWPEVQRGDLIDLRRNRALGALIESRVVSIGAAIEALPQALWLDPRTPEYGRPILARLAQDDLVPGERLSAEFSRREGK